MWRLNFEYTSADSKSSPILARCGLTIMPLQMRRAHRISSLAEGVWRRNVQRHVPASKPLPLTCVRQWIPLYHCLHKSWSNCNSGHSDQATLRASRGLKHPRPRLRLGPSRSRLRSSRPRPKPRLVLSRPRPRPRPRLPHLSFEMSRNQESSLENYLTAWNRWAQS